MNSIKLIRSFFQHLSTLSSEEVKNELAMNKTLAKLGDVTADYNLKLLQLYLHPYFKVETEFSAKLTKSLLNAARGESNVDFKNLLNELLNFVTDRNNIFKGEKKAYRLAGMFDKNTMKFVIAFLEGKFFIDIDVENYNDIFVDSIYEIKHLFNLDIKQINPSQLLFLASENCGIIVERYHPTDKLVNFIITLGIIGEGQIHIFDKNFNELVIPDVMLEINGRINNIYMACGFGHGTLVNRSGIDQILVSEHYTSMMCNINNHLRWTKQCQFNTFLAMSDINNIIESEKRVLFDKNSIDIFIKYGARGDYLIREVGGTETYLY